MASKDFYATLGVPKTATDDEIKKSFRRLAHEHHPDKGGDPQKFKDINEAYQVLGDKTKRATYDKFGSAAFDPNAGFGGADQGFGGFGGFGGNQGGFRVNMEDMGDLGEMFGEMFGFGGAKSGAKRGKDIETEVQIDFLESVTGVTKNLKLYINAKCSACNGDGGEPGSKPEQCKTCQGKGKVQQSARTIFGTIQTVVACPECHGVGTRPSIICKKCKGLGIEKINKEISVPIPAGISDGEAIRITGAGEYPGIGGAAGDLFVRVNVKNHPTFSRENSDVVSTVHLPYSMLSLGGDVEVDTVDGKGLLNIPDATEPGTVFKVRGKGFPFMRSTGRGDHLITVQPIVQRKLSKEQKKALEELKNVGL
ncbi:MAG: DnaJ C-terminal domain-containing protein [Patescibacteria group bacterium]